jgi:putative transposase
MSRHAVRLSPKALFRHQVVAEVRARMSAGMTRRQAILAVVRLPHLDHLGGSRVLFPRTVNRWMESFGKRGLSALEDAVRARVADSTVLSQELLSFLRREKNNDRRASVPELIRRAREAHILDPNTPVDRSSVWRACTRMGLPLTRVKRLADSDMRRFAYPNRMLMVLADGKHFRAGHGRLRRLALVFLDDATRFALDAWVGFFENTELFLRGLHDTIRAFGLMVSLFLDNGPGFISDDTRAAVAQLGVNLIHGTAGYPEGHGKIERFNQTLLARFLRGLDGNPGIDPDPAALRLRLLHFLREDYNKTSHESLKQRTPEECFLSDPRPLELPPDLDWLASRFVITEKRTVTKDNVIAYDGGHYEVPRGRAGTRIEVFRHLLLDDALSVLHQGLEVRLHKVDLVANAYSRRARSRPVPSEPEPTAAPLTAAERAFQQDFAPLVGEDGGYPEGDDE